MIFRTERNSDRHLVKDAMKHMLAALKELSPTRTHSAETAFVSLVLDSKLDLDELLDHYGF